MKSVNGEQYFVRTVKEDLNLSRYLMSGLHVGSLGQI